MTKYTIFLDEIIIQPLTKAAEEDHPLNPNPNSQWQSFFKDNEVLLQVIILFNSIGSLGSGARVGMYCDL